MFVIKDSFLGNTFLVSLYGFILGVLKGLMEVIMKQVLYLNDKRKYPSLDYRVWLNYIKQRMSNKKRVNLKLEVVIKGGT